MIMQDGVIRGNWMKSTLAFPILFLATSYKSLVNVKLKFFKWSKKNSSVSVLLTLCLFSGIWDKPIPIFKTAHSWDFLSPNLLNWTKGTPSSLVIFCHIPDQSPSQKPNKIFKNSKTKNWESLNYKWVMFCLLILPNSLLSYISYINKQTTLKIKYQALTWSHPFTHNFDWHFWF